MTPAFNHNRPSTRPNAGAKAKGFPSGRDLINRYRYFILAALLLPVILYLAAAAIQSPAERVQATVARMAQIVAQEDADALAPFIADDYEGEIEADKQALLDMARMYFSEVDDARINIERTFVQLDGDTAEVMVLYRFRAKVNIDTYRNVPVDNLFEEDPNVPEKTYLRLRNVNGNWQLEFIALQGRPYASRFPEAAKYF